MNFNPTLDLQAITPFNIAACIRTPEPREQLLSLLPGAAVYADPATLLKATHDGAAFRAFLLEQGDNEAFSAAIEMKSRHEAMQVRLLRHYSTWTADIARTLKSIETTLREPRDDQSALDDLLVAAHLQRYSGTWIFNCDTNYGCLWFEKGHITKAETMNGAGVNALTEIKTWPLGRIELHNSFAMAEATQSLIYTMEVDTMKAKETEALLSQLGELDGYIGSSLVSVESGMVVSKHMAMSNFNMDIAAATNSEVVKAKLRAATALGLNDTIEDILITLGKQYHLIRPMRSRPAYFFYLAIGKNGNLAMARLQLEEIESHLSGLLS